jgi:hypothetical protein
MNVHASFNNFEYEQGLGPSNIQSFAINYENLTSGIRINAISPVTPLEFSLNGVGWSASLDTTNTYSGTGTITAYARLKSGLSASLYNGQFYVSFPQDGDAIPVNYYAAVKVPQQNVTIAGVYAPLRTFFGYPSASTYVSNPQEIEVYVENATFASMSIIVTSSYELCVDRSPTSPVFFTSSVSQSIITASGITDDYSLKFWMRLRSGSAGSVDTTLTVVDQSNNTLATASIVGRRYAGESSIDCWGEAAEINMLWRNIGTNGVTAYGFAKHIYYENPTNDYIDFVSSSFITRNEWNDYFNRTITNSQKLHVRVVTPTTTLIASSPDTTSQVSFPPVTSTWWLDNTRVPTSPEFVTIKFQILEPELVFQFTTNTNLTGIFNSPLSFTGLDKIRYQASISIRGSQTTTADIQSQRFLGLLLGTPNPADTNGFLDAVKVPNKVGRITANAARGGKRDPYYYPTVYSKISQTVQNVPLNNVYQERNFQETRLIDNIQQDGFIDADTQQITLNGIPLPETSDLSIYPSLQNITLANLTGSLTTLYIPQNLTTLSISGSPVSYSINQESAYLGKLDTFNIGQSGSTNILNYDSFISNLRFTTSSQFTLTGAPTSSLPAIPSAVTASIVGGGPFEEFNFRTFYTPGEPTMSVATINGTGMLYTPGMTMSFDPSVSDLKSVTVTNMTSSYDVDLSNLVSASVSITSDVRNVTLPITYADDNEVITINSTNLENVYIPVNANYSGSRNTTLGLIPGFNIDTLDLSGSFITNLTVSSSGYFNSFRRLLGGFETIRNYNFQFSSFDAGGVEYFLSQVSASGVKDYPTAGSTTGSITDSTKNWITNAYAGSTIRVFDNSGNSYNDIITSNTTSSVNFGRMVAGGSGTNSIAYSDDYGLTWVGVTGTSIFSNFGWAVVWNGTRFVAGGRGTNSLAHSADGISWTGLGTTIFADQCRAIIWTGTRFIAGGTLGIGTNTLAYSSDGINWTGLGTGVFNSSVQGLAYNGSRIVAVGNGTNSIAYSDDGGLTWTGLGSTVGGINNGWGVAWNGIRWVVVGNGTSAIAHSLDGITWTGLGGSIFSSSGRSVTWNGSMFVAVGTGTNTIAYSTDGITWTGLGTSIFSNEGRSVAWNGTRWVAGSSSDTTNTLAYSSDGISWTGLGKSTFSTSTFGIGSTSPFTSVVPNAGVYPTTTAPYGIQDGSKSIDLRNQKNGLYISLAISASKATLEGLGWTVNL